MFANPAERNEVDGKGAAPSVAIGIRSKRKLWPQKLRPAGFPVAKSEDGRQAVPAQEQARDMP